MSIDAMKQALEALEAALSDDKPYIIPSQDAITALRAAITEAERQEPVAQQVCGYHFSRYNPFGQVVWDVDHAVHPDAIEWHPLVRATTQPSIHAGWQLVPKELPDSVSDQLGEKYGHIPRGWKVAYFRILNLLAAAPKQEKTK